jgi:hypothetical protein
MHESYMLFVYDKLYIYIGRIRKLVRSTLIDPSARNQFSNTEPGDFHALGA